MTRPFKYHFTQQELEDLYIQQQLSCEKIAEIKGCGHSTVSRNLEMLNIPRRFSEFSKITKDILNELYLKRKRSTHKIANIFGCCDESIRKKLKKYNIKRRLKTAHCHKKSHPRYNHFLDDEVIKDLYIKAQWTSKKIAEHFNTNHMMILRRLEKMGVEIMNRGFSNGAPYICKDGHRVMSFYEKQVDDWLNKHQIEHQYNYPLPFGKTCSADFKIDGYFIEVWGVIGLEWYNERRRKKIEEYKLRKMNLIQLYPRDVTENLDKKLAILLGGKR